MSTNHADIQKNLSTFITTVWIRKEGIWPGSTWTRRPWCGTGMQCQDRMLWASFLSHCLRASSKFKPWIVSQFTSKQLKVRLHCLWWLVGRSSSKGTNSVSSTRTFFWQLRRHPTMTSLFGRLLVTVSDFKTGIAEALFVSAFSSKMYKHSAAII